MWFIGSLISGCVLAACISLGDIRVLVSLLEIRDEQRQPRAILQRLGGYHLALHPPELQCRRLRLAGKYLATTRNKPRASTTCYGDGTAKPTTRTGTTSPAMGTAIVHRRSPVLQARWQLVSEPPVAPVARRNR